MMIANRYQSFRAKAYVILRSFIFPFSSIEKYYPKQGIIYDMGCGYGSYSLYLAISSKKLAICDCISLIDIIHHIPYKTQQELIKECFKKLKRGGVLLLKDLADKPRWKYFYNYFHDRFIMGNKELYFRTTKEIYGMCSSAGFKVEIKDVKTWVLNPFSHILFICNK